MEKRIYIKINDYIINTTGEINNNTILCIDNNDNKTNIIYDITKNTLIRLNEEYKITIDFNNEQVQYYLKKENKTLINSFKLISKEKTKNNIKIIYELNNNQYNLEIICK